MGNNTKLLFVGGMFFDCTIDEVLKNSKSAIQNAANKLQWNYVNGIESNIKDNIDILNSVFIGTFPKYYKKMFIPNNIIKRKDSSKSINDIGFINLPIISDYSKFHGMKKILLKWLRENAEYKKIIVAYGFFNLNFRLLEYAKKIDSTKYTLPIDKKEYKTSDFVLSILNGIFLGIPGLIFQVIWLIDAKKDNEYRYKKMLKGYIIGVVSVIIFMILLFFLTLIFN